MKISNKEDRFIQSAAEQAELSPCLMRHGCVAVRNGRIVGRGFNNYRSQSKDGFINNCMTCHAEIAALRQVNKREIKRFNRIILYVVRVDSRNNLQESAPCMDCMNLIQGLHIKRVSIAPPEATSLFVSRVHITANTSQPERKSSSTFTFNKKLFRIVTFFSLQHLKLNPDFQRINL